MLYIKEQMELHPTMNEQDALKMCYQAAFGAEHLISDGEGVKAYFDEEYSSVEPTDEPLCEMLSDKVCRVNMGAWKKRGMPSEWLYKMFLLSAVINEDGNKAFAEYTEEISNYFPCFHKFFEEYLLGGVRPVHHSNLYREKEAPHYRVVSAEFLSVIPVLEKICSANAKIISIDGRAASGKTTLTKMLCSIIGASAVHMDDFFLPPELRTKERLSEPGGNVHYERFIDEVLTHINSGKDFSYTVFDCSVMDYGEKRVVPSESYIIVEGAYSHHPRFNDYADLRVFMDVSPDEQINRIVRRNGEKMAEMFKSRWIPMEEKYYNTFNIKEKSHFIISNE